MVKGKSRVANKVLTFMSHGHLHSESQDSLEFQETLNKGRLMRKEASAANTMVSPVLDDAVVA